MKKSIECSSLAGISTACFNILFNISSLFYIFSSNKIIFNFLDFSHHNIPWISLSQGTFGATDNETHLLVKQSKNLHILLKF